MSRPLAAAAAGAVTVFLALAGLVAFLPAFGQLDATFHEAVDSWRAGRLPGLFLAITALGAGTTLVAVACAVSLILWSAGRARLVTPLWIAYLGTMACTWTAKFVVDRDRPTFLEIASAESPSFPSAHSAGAAALYAFIAFLAVRESGAGVVARLAIGAAAAAVILAVGFSRFYLSLHHLTDVLAGFALGAFWTCIGIAALNRRRRPDGSA